MDGPPFPPEEFHQRNFLCTVALTALLWDWVISFDNEVQFIWRSPSNTNKWVYLISRYLGIISQLVESAMIFSNECKPVAEEICRKWVGFETAAGTILFGLIEVIQVLRVYAFYNKNMKLGIFLATWFCVEMCGAVYYLWYTAIHLDFDPSCAVIHVPLISLVYLVFLVANQATILSVLFWRRRAFAPGSLEDVPVAYIVLRDGVLLFLAVCGMIATSTIWGTFQENHLFMNAALNTILSIAACRMALNLQSMKRPRSTASSLPEEVPLTTLSPSSGAMPTIIMTPPPHSSYSFHRIDKP